MYVCIALPKQQAAIQGIPSTYMLTAVPAWQLDAAPGPLAAAFCYPRIAVEFAWDARITDGTRTHDVVYRGAWVSRQPLRAGYWDGRWDELHLVLSRYPSGMTDAAFLTAHNLRVAVCNALLSNYDTVFKLYAELAKMKKLSATERRGLRAGLRAVESAYGNIDVTV